MVAIMHDPIFQTLLNENVLHSNTIPLIQGAGFSILINPASVDCNKNWMLEQFSLQQLLFKLISAHFVDVEKLIGFGAGSVNSNRAPIPSVGDVLELLG